MINDEAKTGLLEWLFGKKALDKAGQQGQNPIPVQPPTQSTDYIRQQIEQQESLKKKPVAPMTPAVPQKKAPPIPKPKAVKKLINEDDYY